MRASRYHEYGDPSVLQVEDVDRPSARRGELVVEVEAAGVNPLDTKLRAGTYDWVTPPMAPGADFAGVVSEVGADAAGYEVGDRVFGTGLGIAQQGTAAEYVRTPLENVAHLPESVSFEDGAALALVGVTAWETLVERGGLTAADTCLIHGGSGGVGHVAVQVAAAAGADVIATAAPEYHDEVRDLGADTVVDYARDDLADAIGAAGAPDVILDHRIDEHVDLNTQVCAQDADVVAISGTSLELTYSNSGLARAKLQSLHHFALPKLASYTDSLERVASLAAAGDVAPVVDQTYDLDDVDDAHRATEAGGFLGKVVVVP